MKHESAGWKATTHEWADSPDVDHLEQIRRQPGVFAPSGLMHLVLEVLAYAADEAVSNGFGRGVVTLHRDGSVAIADNGRGTDTRVDHRGRKVEKPVMATRDLRFFDSPNAAILADGHPRRGMSVVAALSEWLIHTNRRLNGSWTQRYEHGIPVTDLTPIPDDCTIGTVVHFLPSRALVSNSHISASKLRRLAASFRPLLPVEVYDEGD